MGMMGATQLGMSMLQGQAAIQASKSQSQAATENSRREWQEFHRQQKEVSAQARADKSDRAREADKLMGQMIAVMADNGGAGTSNESRFAGEIGYLEGLDISRIEGNRRREVEALNSAKTASAWRALNIISSAGAKSQGAIWNIASTATDIAGRRAKAKLTTTTTTGTPPTSGRRFGAPRTDAAGRILGGI